MTATPPPNGSPDPLPDAPPALPGPASTSAGSGEAPASPTPPPPSDEPVAEAPASPASPAPVPPGARAPRRKRNRAAGPKLATRVYDKYPVDGSRPSGTAQITGNPPGRPRVPDALKRAFLGALRYGNDEQTSRAIAGISDSVVDRWKAEATPPGGMSFTAQIEQAKALALVNVGRKLVQRAERGNLSAAMFFLRARHPAYSNRPAPITTDVAKQIRAMVTAAQASQDGVDDPNAVPRYEPPEDDDLPEGST